MERVIQASVLPLVGREMSVEETSKPWRHRLRISVRALMILVLIPGGGLGWVVHQANVQRDAVAAILRSNGWCDYDWKFKDGAYNPNGKPWAPWWLVSLIGVDYFGHVTRISLREWAPEEDLAHIGRLSRLESIQFLPRTVTDAGMVHLAGLSRLQSLNLRDTSVTDAGLVHLAGLSRLRSLDLRYTKITDAGLVHLAGWTRLEWLSLRDTSVTDAGMVHLRGLTRLRSLNLGNTDVTDAGLKYLMGLTNLRKLEVVGSEVTKAGTDRLRRSLPGVSIVPTLPMPPWT